MSREPARRIFFPTRREFARLPIFPGVAPKAPPFFGPPVALPLTCRCTPVALLLQPSAADSPAPGFRPPAPVFARTGSVVVPGPTLALLGSDPHREGLCP